MESNDGIGLHKAEPVSFSARIVNEFSCNLKVALCKCQQHLS